MSRDRTRRRGLAAMASMALALTSLGVVALAAPAGAAPGSGSGAHGQTLTVSQVDDLDPDGATVTVTGSGYDIAGFDIAEEGMYLALCVDLGPAVAPSPCVGGVDVSGSGGASRWLTNNGFPGTPSVPIGADGSFTTTLTLQAADAYVDCNDLPAGQSCKVVTRMDHRASGDRTQDVKVAVDFAEPTPGPRLALSPSAGILSGEDVVVSGTGFPTAGPGLYVVFGPQPLNNTDATMYGAQAFVPSAMVQPDGSFTTTLHDVKPVYVGENDQSYDFRSGGGFISTIRAHGTPDPAGDWSASQAVTFRARTATESFVTAAHTDFLGAEPTRAVLATDVAALNNGQSKATYLRGLSTSDAWLSAIVNDLYQDTLGRNGGAAEIDFWAGRLRAGWSVARVAASFYSSPEYFNGIGGGANDSWVRDLYQKILLRTAGNADVAYWSSEVVAKGRGNVALRMYQSPESAGTRVRGLYQSLLGRNPGSADLAYWRPIVVSRGDLSLAVSLASVAEYAGRANTRFP